MDGPLGAGPHFPKYFLKSALPARSEKFPKISPDRLTSRLAQTLVETHRRHTSATPRHPRDLTRAPSLPVIQLLHRYLAPRLPAPLHPHKPLSPRTGTHTPSQQSHMQLASRLARTYRAASPYRARVALGAELEEISPNIAWPREKYARNK